MEQVHREVPPPIAVPAPAAAEENEQPGPVVAPKPSRKRHRQNTILPTRPKKPATAYTMFLKHYFNTHPAQPGVTAREMLGRAGEEWRGLPADQKEQYALLCQPDQENYRAQMDIWKRQKNTFKRPPSSYAMFLKDFWVRQREANTVEGDVQAMGRRCKAEWDVLPEDQKNVYKQRYAEAAVAHKNRMEQVMSGQLNVHELVNGVPAPAQDADGDEGDEDDDAF